MRKTYHLSTAPVDYQQLWYDMLEATFEDIDIESVKLECDLLPVSTFRPELLEEMQNWTEYDLERVVAMSYEVLLETLPPLIHTNEFLNDGYHRVAACMLTGVEKFYCVSLPDTVSRLNKELKIEKST